MGAVLGIFTGPYALLAKWGVIALLLAAFGGFCWLQGNEHGTQKLIDYQGAQVVEAVRISAAREKVTEKVVVKYVKVKGDTQVVTRTVKEEVVKYAESNPGFCLDAPWRLHHDAAALNAVPAPGLVPDGAGGAPKAAAALAVVTDNYAACHRTADRLDALQEWVREQAAVR